MTLLSNNLLIRRVKTTMVRGIHLPPQWTDEWNDGLTQMYRLIQKGPGRVTRKGVRIPFEAEPGDNLIVTIAHTGPQPFGDGNFILKDPEATVLAVVPMQKPGIAPLPP